MLTGSQAFPRTASLVNRSMGGRVGGVQVAADGRCAVSSQNEKQTARFRITCQLVFPKCILHQWVSDFVDRDSAVLSSHSCPSRQGESFMDGIIIFSAVRLCGKAASPPFHLCGIVVFFTGAKLSSQFG